MAELRPRPNVLFIMTDQQALRAMSCTGNSDLHTPHMDSIARAGLQFTNSYCTSPVCTPSRASLMTGRMPHELGINTLGFGLNDATPTLGTMFRQAGYRTAYTGKWHLQEHYFWQNIDTHGFEFLTFPKTGNAGHGVATDAPTANAAIAFLKEKHEKPFALVVSLQNPHDICGAIKCVTPLPPGQGPQLPSNFPRDPHEPQFITDCRQRSHYGPEQIHTAGWSLEHWRSYLDVYYRYVERVDQQVGRILQTLRQQGLEQNTLVVFTSDHGEGIASHHWVVKLMLYEEPVTVPLIFSWPGVIPAGTIDRTHLASGADIVPTLCDYAGIIPPAGLAGTSLKPIIDQPALPGREYVISELQVDTEDPSRLGRMVRTDRYKYVVFSYGRNSELLFDLQQDRGELRNLARLPEHEVTLQQHRLLLSQWIERTGDHFPLSRVPAETQATPESYR